MGSNNCLPCKDICECITLNSPNNTISIGRNDCTFTLEVNLAEIPEVINVADGSETIVNAGLGINVTGTGTIATPYVIANTGVLSVNGNTGNVVVPTYDGSETKLTAGTNMSVTGAGTVGSPYVVNCTLSVPPTPDGSETIVTAGTGISIAGNGTVATPYVITNNGVTSVNGNTGAIVIATYDGSETKVQAGTDIIVSGTGTVGDPYIITSDVTIPPAPDGSETIVNAGSNISVLGSGTLASPYIIACTLDGSETYVTAGDGIGVTGTGTSADPYEITADVTSVNGMTGDVVISIPTVDGSETIVQAGANVTVTGVGTLANPYIVSTTTSACASTIRPFDGAECCVPLDDALVFSDGIVAANVTGETCHQSVTLVDTVNVTINFDPNFASLVEPAGEMRAGLEAIYKENIFTKLRGHMTVDNAAAGITAGGLAVNCFSLTGAGSTHGAQTAYASGTNREWYVWGFDPTAADTLYLFKVRCTSAGQFSIKGLTGYVYPSEILYINMEPVIFETE